ncbi:MAG: biotin--[acetyl-CoA-carboxylase] ligase [Treponema sp.]|jgi:BirA family biotin operon repressor/biotin-[acetyl-CoA-carboxylase] ligase|nr:biotin--[acetyl-CoA-carboxylase] ligase [Treponema sp.]
MKKLNIINPFNAPVYHEETVSSTMDVSRRLASEGEPHGTVITADFQEAGRGRGQDRVWQMNRGENLPFTILLRYPRVEDIPSALTLRAGLAVSFAIEDFAPCLRSKVKIKWPNDIIINDKKNAGILCEADGGIVHIGIGLNAAQKEFPAALREKAVSIALAADKDIAPEERFILLEEILARFFDELNAQKNITDWKSRLEQRLYKKGEQVVFVEGEADSGREVKGRLEGIGEGGELLILAEGETQTRAFVTGELKIFV